MHLPCIVVEPVLYKKRYNIHKAGTYFSINFENLAFCLYYCIRPCCASKAFADLNNAEPLLDGMKNVIIARPCGLCDDPGKGKFFLTTADNYDILNTNIAREDVACAMVSFLDDKSWDGKAVSIVNARCIHNAFVMHY